MTSLKFPTKCIFPNFYILKINRSRFVTYGTTLIFAESIAFMCCVWC